MKSAQSIRLAFELNHSFQQRVVSFEQISCKTDFLARYPSNLEKMTILTQTEV